MYTATLSKSDFEKLKKFDPGKNIPNTECELFIKGSLRSKNKERILLKKYYVREGEYFGRKLKNLNTLIYYKNILGEIKELVLPDKLAIIDGEIVGYTMPFIEKSKNLQTILNSDISLEDKLTYLRQIGTILEKIKNIKDFPYDFHIGDLHEGNFLIDSKNLLRVVDLDSTYISNNKPFDAKYLSSNKILGCLPHKYMIDKDEEKIIPSINSDLYCYVMVVLNTISKVNMSKVSIHNFYRYINYLEDIGINKDMIYAVEKIYHSGDNESILPYLTDDFAKRAYQATNLIYKKRTGNSLI